MSSDRRRTAAARLPSVVHPTVRPVVLLILDGFGDREAAPDNAIAHAAMPNWQRAARERPAHDDRRVRTACRPAGRPDGQFGSRPSQHRCRPRHLPGLHADRPRDRDRRIRRESGAASPRLPRRATAAAALHVLGLLSPGGVHSHERQIAAMVDMAAARGVQRSARARVPRRPRHAAAERRRVARVHGPTCARGIRARASPRSSAATTRWTATSAGSASRPPTNCWSTAARRTRRHVRSAALEAAYARGETDEFVKATAIVDAAGSAARWPTATSSCS